MGRLEIGIKKEGMTYAQIHTIVDTLQIGGFEITYLNIRLREE